MPCFEETRAFQSTVKKRCKSSGILQVTVPHYLADLLGLKHYGPVVFRYRKGLPKHLTMEKFEY